MTTRFTEFKRVWKSPALDQALASKSTNLLATAVDRLAAAILCAIFWGLTGGVLGGLIALVTHIAAVQVAGMGVLIGGSFGVGVGLSSRISHALKATGLLKIMFIGTLTIGLGLLLGYAVITWSN
ncbi:MAG TPA: hypothetical protein PKE64_31225 [Anaerolineae bacterium]|nr:hypothetical protein [Anaerolineae bacterium]HMR68505.1 hypothetical protein [Anaerolineae bacterium]